jgi:threonylcarbamoyladenosine tRNA methylthiotransferase MtaB
MAERSRRMRELARGMRHAQAASLVGCDDLALVQYPGRAVTGGLFDVRLDPAIPVDSLVRVRLSSVMPDGTLVASAL